MTLRIPRHQSRADREYQHKKMMLEHLVRAPQSPSTEWRIQELQWAIREADAERELRRLSVARLLVRAYEETGSMSVILPDGRTFTDKPVHANSKVQNILNIYHRAYELASLSTDASA